MAPDRGHRPTNAGGLSIIGLLAITLGLVVACSDDTPNPAAAKEQRLIGKWDLRAVKDLDDVEFSYTFSRDGTAINTVGGEILTALRNMEELDEDVVAELDKLQGIDGGDLEWRGTWTTRGDSLDIRFDSVAISLFGRIPVIGKLSVPVYSQELEESEVVELGFRCAVLTETELTLQGRSLTAGVTPDVGAVDPAHTQALGNVGEEGVRLVGERLLSLIRDNDLDEFEFTRD